MPDVPKPPKRRKKPRPRLSKKARLLLSGVANGLPIAEAGRAAGFNTRQGAHRSFQVIKLRFHEALQNKGYDVDETLTAIYEKLREKMEAQETLFFQKDGIVMETRNVVAHDIQLRATHDLATFIGATPRNGNGHDEQPSGGLTINIGLILSDEAGKVLDARTQEMPGLQPRSTIDGVLPEKR